MIILSLLMVGSGPYGGPAMAAGGPEITLRRVCDGPDVDWMGDPSPDGRYLTFVDWEGGGHLALRELATGETRTLVKAPKPYDEFAESSVWSPDGKQVAYGFYSERGFEEIRVVELEGGESRVVYSNPNDAAWPVAWFPDGETILAISSTKDMRWGLSRVSLADGTASVLKRFDWPRHRLGAVSLSPDGKNFGYDFPAAKDSPQRDIYLLAADGSSDRVLVAHPANDRLLGWAPDGWILFLSDRTGEHDLWTLKVEDGRAVGQPKLLKKDIGIIQPVGLTASGSFFYFRQTDMHDVYVAEVDLDAGRLVSSPVRATERFLGATAYPAWSSDGRYLAYIVHKGPLYSQVTDDRIRTLSTGEERELVQAFRRTGRPRWSPDGSSLLVCGAKDKVNLGCYRLEVATGECSTIFEAADEKEIIGGRAWSPDGKVIFYASRNGTDWHGRIVKRDLETGQELVLYSISSFHNPIPLAVSPDGSKLAFALTHVKVGDQYQPHTVMLVPANGGEPRELARVEPEGIIGDTLFWTPDGRDVVFGTRRRPSEPAQFWAVAPGIGESKELFAIDMAGAWSFRLHPDRRRLAFVAGHPGAEIWVMENYLSGAGSEE